MLFRAISAICLHRPLHSYRTSSKMREHDASGCSIHRSAVFIGTDNNTGWQHAGRIYCQPSVNLAAFYAYATSNKHNVGLFINCTNSHLWWTLFPSFSKLIPFYIL